MSVDSSGDPVAVLLEFIHILNNLGIPYVVGGSFASSVHGEFRSTNDFDLVCQFSKTNVAPFCATITHGFVGEEMAIKKAIDGGDSFSVIHRDAILKIDVFTRINDFEAEQLRRAVELRIPETEGTVNVATAEDVLLAKLRWFRMGGGVSDRQWRDILGIVRTQNCLDEPYLQVWATRLQVSDLLEKALKSRSEM